MDHGGKAVVGFIGSHGDALKLREFAEEVLDQMTPFVEFGMSGMGVARRGCCEMTTDCPGCICVDPAYRRSLGRMGRVRKAGWRLLPPSRIYWVWPGVLICRYCLGEQRMLIAVSFVEARRPIKNIFPEDRPWIRRQGGRN